MPGSGIQNDSDSDIFVNPVVRADTEIAAACRRFGETGMLSRFPRRLCSRSFRCRHSVAESRSPPGVNGYCRQSGFARRVGDFRKHDLFAVRRSMPSGCRAAPDRIPQARLRNKFDQSGTMRMIGSQISDPPEPQRNGTGISLMKMVDDFPACHHSMVIGLSRRRFVVVHLAPVALQYPEPSAMLVVYEVVP